MAVQAAETYGYEINPELKKIFTTYVTTHNDAVFGAYTPEMRLARKTHVVTGLPDTYGRGRIVGDYRRVALYGIDRLIEAKKVAHYRAGCGNMYDDVIRMREEISQQLKALNEMKKMAEIYGYDISRAGKKCPRSSSVAVFWISGCSQDSEWCSNECWTYFYIPGYLHSA